MNINNSLQKLLKYGYLYLVLLGIFKECIYYYFMDIVILRHSTLFDIIVSPISALTSNPSMLLTCAIVIIAIYFATNYFLKNSHKSWVRKVVNYKVNFDELNHQEIKTFFENFFIRCSALCLLGFFIGTGLSDGLDVSENLKNGKIEYNHIITFNSSEQKEIYLLGTNSMNYFYVEKGNNNVKISQIGAIKSLEKNYNK